MHYFILLLLVLTGSWANAQIYRTDFEQYAAGTNYTGTQWTSDGFAPRWLQGTERTMVDDHIAYSGQKSLRIFYPAGKYGPAETGTQTPLQLSPKREYYASYRVRFSEDFSWGTTQFGGKLPGLTAGANCSGCQICTGSNGFSARFMWRPGGRAALYLYHMDKPTACGEDHYLEYPNGDPVYFQRGQWMHIAQRVKINTGSNHDGEVEVWVNGQKVLLLEGLRFVTDGSLIDNFYISTFHGGDTPNWAPAIDSYMWIDDLVVADQYEEVAFQNCSKPELGPDQSLCDVEDLLLSSSLTGEQYAYTWLKNGESISGETAASVTVDQPGLYILVLDSLGCFTRDTIVVSAGLTVNLGADRSICTSSWELLDPGQRGSYLTYEWYRNGEPLPHASPAIQVAQAGEYELRVSSPQCGAMTGKVSLESGLPDVIGDTVCPGETALLKVNEQGVFNWYDADGIYLRQGNELEVVADQPAVYYVADANAFSGYVGKKTAVAGTTYTDNRWDRKMLFTVYRTLRIESIEIHAVDNQNVTIRIERANGQLVESKTFQAVEAGANRLELAMQLEPGDYAMSAEGTTGRLLHSHEMDEDIRFPYIVEGIISISGSNIAWINQRPYYLFFYNWKISSGNICAPAPVGLFMDDDCMVSGMGMADYSEYKIFPNPSESTFIIEADGSNHLDLYNIHGVCLVELSFTDRVEFGAGLEKGIYFYRLKDTRGAIVKTGKLIRR